MTVTPEQVRKLSEASGVDEIAALSALERHDGDLLEAMLELERQGRVPPPPGGGTYSTHGKEAPPDGGHEPAPGGAGPERNWYWVKVGGWMKAGSGDELWRGLKDLFRRSMVNRLEVWRRGRMVAGMPLLVLLLLLVCFFWIMALVLGLGLVLGFRYRFGGPDMDRQSIDRAVKNAADAASRAVGRVKAEFERRKH